jgi:intraflagellar transport protein 56
MVKNPAYVKEKFYTQWLARCYIKNKRPEAAWNLYVDAPSIDDSKQLLHLIAADCFADGLYYYAMRAYDVLAKFEPEPMHHQGLISSSVGVFRAVLTRKETPEKLNEVMQVLAGEHDARKVLEAIQQYTLESGEFGE